jgi:hypothetical protein
MIVHKRLWADLVLHYIFVFTILAFFSQKNSFPQFLAASVIATLLITLINHVFLPWFRLRTEAFQACYLRTGVKPCDCPLRPFCPHRQMCEYNAAR